MTKPYVVTAQPVVNSPLAGMAKWVELAVKHSNGSLWNNGIWIVRDVKNRPGVISNHARGLATDLSYRWQAQKNKGVRDGRKQSLAYIVKLLEHADTLGIQLVIDYALQRSWRSDRGTWQGLPSVDIGDWYHVEVEPRLAHDPEATKEAFQAVFGAFPTSPPKLV